MFTSTFPRRINMSSSLLVGYPELVHCVTSTPWTTVKGLEWFLKKIFANDINAHSQSSVVNPIVLNDNWTFVECIASQPSKQISFLLSLQTICLIEINFYAVGGIQGDILNSCFPVIEVEMKHDKSTKDGWIKFPPEASGEVLFINPHAKNATEAKKQHFWALCLFLKCSFAWQTKMVRWITTWILNELIIHSHS